MGAQHPCDSAREAPQPCELTVWSEGNARCPSPRWRRLQACQTRQALQHFDMPHTRTGGRRLTLISGLPGDREAGSGQLDPAQLLGQCTAVSGVLASCPFRSEGACARAVESLLEPALQAILLPSEACAAKEDRKHVACTRSPGAACRDCGRFALGAGG